MHNGIRKHKQAFRNEKGIQMISLKRNSKLELVPALGVRKRQSSIYTPFQKEKLK